MKETNMTSLLTIIATHPELLMVMLTDTDKHYKILVSTSYSESFRFKSWPCDWLSSPSFLWFPSALPARYSESRQCPPPFNHAQCIIHSQPLASSVEWQYTFSNRFKATSTEIGKYLPFYKCI